MALLSMGFCTSPALAQASPCIDNSSYIACLYGLRAAPSEISFPAESAVKTRLALVSTIQDQIGLSQSHRGASGINAWISGSLTGLSMNNSSGLPNDPDLAWTGTAGADYALSKTLTAGFALSTGSLRSSLGSYGSFRMNDNSASLYAALQKGSIWANAIGTYGHFGLDTTRIVNPGPNQMSNYGSAGGDNWSGALQGGYVFQKDAWTHGPVGGLIYQDVSIDGFAETGSPVSLTFGSQTRQATVGQFGYLAIYDFGKYQPYAQASWNHEFAVTARDVSASWKSLSFTMPAVLLGKDWGETKTGVKIDVGSGVKLVVEGTADFGQTSATLYSGQIGINAAF
jgi:outer membrane lipase/esterase